MRAIMRELNIMKTMFDIYMIISVLLVLVSVVSVYMIICRLRYREGVIMQRERELYKDELWLEHRLKDIEKREDRLNRRVKEYRFLTD